MSSAAHRSPAPLIPPDLTFGQVTDQLIGIPLQRGFSRRWLAVSSLALAAWLFGLVSATWLFVAGIGVWGVNIPVAWGFAIINFVWWIGIGHAGTLISAILLLFRQRWRNSINRFAEAMTLFALVQAGLFPLFHLGRPWLFYYIAPYPNTMELWPQWRSPLVWDMFAVATYSLVSLLFWYLGLVPDLATMRDTARRHWVRLVTGVLSLGWRGSARHWRDYSQLYLLLAGLATPLVVSVHSIVSLDFAISIVPGWHSTIFPPYFVAGAIYSGFAMVLTLAIPIRAIYGLNNLITAKHLDNMAKVMLVSALIVGYGYLMEHFIAWYSGETGERFVIWNRAFGPYRSLFWLMLFCNVAVAQALWLRGVRASPAALFVVSILINVGMWLERFVIVIISLHRDYLPSAWGTYVPTVWDWTLLAGSIGFFVLLMLLFTRLLPMVSIFEMREMIHEGQTHGAVRGKPADIISEQSGAASAAEIDDQDLYGLAAEFESAEELAGAAKEASQSGYSRVDAYGPFPAHQVWDALALRPSRIPVWVLAGAAIGATGAYIVQAYSAVFDYPWNIGGRPLHSWPSFIPLIFEMGVLGGALSGCLGLLVTCGLPAPYHPMLNVNEFWRASRDRFFLCIEARDPNFSRVETRQFLRRTGARWVVEVPL